LMIISELNKSSPQILTQKSENALNNNINKKEPAANLESRSVVTPIDNQPSHKTLTCIKEACISMIPVYGTIQEFKKGNYGWGALGIVSDVALLAIPAAYLGKVLFGLVRGSSIATKIATTGIATVVQEATVMTKTTQEGALLAKEGIEATHIMEGGSTAIKSESVGAKELISASQNSQTVTQTGNISDATKASSTIKDAQSIDRSQAIFQKMPLEEYPRLQKIGINYFRDFKLLGTNKVYKNLLDASRATEFIIDGKKINIDSAQNMLAELNKIFPKDFEKVQLISSYAHEHIFCKPFTKDLLNLANKNIYQLSNPRYSYQFNTLKDKTISFVAKEEGLVTYLNGSLHRNYGIKAEGILSRNAPPELHFSSYVN
ncbi:hypothetical protein, partial [Candidatus Liberibacter asiaticus]